MTTRIEYYRQLTASMQAICQQAVVDGSFHSDEADQALLEALAQLQNDYADGNDYVYLGQEILATIVGRYPHITPKLPRDLLWFYGGECLHYLADAELDQYQELEEKYHDATFQTGDAENTSYSNLRAQIFGLH